MTKAKYTPWFANANPTRVGVYNVSCRKTDQTGDWWSHWNGRRWGGFSGNIESALNNRRFRSMFNKRSGGLNGSWRGLAYDPVEDNGVSHT